ncbi:hypothetical protein AEAC466_17765 [Asticcacaulis sp. AC466]|uniref:alkaline phosphatase family protein n=1 Tax=Asticcacaulis sp. AC466 TaxID=1282362 RepID=UPI0003C3E088|nr:ectonucleotide pyrophosphatase/phosphodiesterase [Asticcacaulis sp. AC466]ESQ82453.1 hypothetical protein AEAC466_17765 [Asticcacaulis sp. AC466]
MRKLASAIVVVACLWLQACAGLPHRAPEPARPLVLISIDAFRADYYDRGVTPRLKALAEGGARGTLRPSFPSLTFPNHYTLVTGKVPDHHGIVANNMYDPTYPGANAAPALAWFDKTKNADGVWWREAKPMWTSATQAGLKVDVVFWPGAQAENDGMRVDYAPDFQKALDSRGRADLLLQRLDQPKRPDVFILYIDAVDEAGHKKGPDSPEVNTALAEADAAVGHLLDGLKARGIDANVIVVSDHGMISVSKDRAVYISQRLGDVPPDLVADTQIPSFASKDPRYDLVYYGAVAMINPRPGYGDALDKALIRTKPDHMQCWHKGDIPTRLKFGSNARVPAIVCLGDPGWQVGGLAPLGTDVGNHGYDPDTPEMTALFIANGPDIRRGVSLGRFDNVDVYSLEMKLLGLKPEPNDGSLKIVGKALRK